MRERLRELADERKRWGNQRLHVLLEREGRGFKPQKTYPSRAVACVSTHDLPTFAGWLAGADIDERATLGQSLHPEAEHADRAQEVNALRKKLATDQHLTAAAHGFVAKTHADLVYVQADDLAGERQAVNLPGTDRERPNWRRRLTLPIDQIFENPLAADILARLQPRKATP